MMECIAFPSPVLAGQEDSPAKFGQQLSVNPGLADFVARSGIGLLRVFQMSAPQGDVVTTYLEAQSLATAFGMQQHDTSEVARLLRRQILDAHGMDIATAPAPSAERFLEHYEPLSPRQPAVGFSAPVVAGKTGVLRDLGSETAGPRQAGWHEFNRGLGVSVHRAFVLGTPMGDFASVYFEAPDPAAANAAFAADTSDFGRYFKATVEEAFGIDFSQPLPPISQLFEVTG
jgi:hypothetical protein